MRDSGNVRGTLLQSVYGKFTWILEFRIYFIGCSNLIVRRDEVFMSAPFSKAFLAKNFLILSSAIFAWNCSSDSDSSTGGDVNLPVAECDLSKISAQYPIWTGAYFIYADGSNVSFKGTISLFTEYPPAVDRSRIIPALQRASLITKDEANALAAAPKNTGTRTNVSGGLNGSAEPKTSGGTKNTVGTSGAGTQKAASGNAEQTKPVQKQLPSKADTQQKIKQTAAQAEKPITVENTEAGIRLTMQNLRFKADSAELLPEEAKRLDQIAAVLKEAPQSQFLVEGHTASTGNEKGEQRLSEERARNIALELSKRGIAEDKFICKGSGGRKPVASNATPEGKARNRRVEITILE